MPRIVLACAGPEDPLVSADGLAGLRGAGEVLVGSFDFADADAVVFSPWGTHGVERYAPDCWASAAQLRVIAGTFDNRVEQLLAVSLRELADRGVTVVDTSRSMTPSVAEFSLAMMLNLVRDIPAQISLVRSGGWLTELAEPAFVAGDLAGRRVGLAGYGVLNRTLARLLSGFGCDVVACDPFVADAVLAADGVRRTGTLTELAAWCEIFVVGIPPTPATLGIVDAHVIGALPRGALFVLPTRMAVVDQEALWRRCAAGELRAAVDVFEPEPPPADAPFRADPNVLPTPHIAGNTLACHRRCFTTACLDTVAVLRGEPARYAMTAADADLYAGRLVARTE